MAGYWPSSFFAFFVEVHKNIKKERGQYPAILTEQAARKEIFHSRLVQDLFSVHFWISL